MDSFQATGYFTRIRYRLETVLVRMGYRFFKALPLTWSSATGGVIAEAIAPLFRRRNEVARDNLKRAMPGISDGEINRIIGGMWNNLGRNFAEFPHLARIHDEELLSIARIEGIENLERACRPGKGVLCFTGHLADWEFAPRLFALSGYPLAVVGRSGNNPGLDELIRQSRAGYISSFIPKGSAGSRMIIQVLNQGGSVGLLVDQKMNDGIKASFFGREAMSAPGIARLALKYDCPILPVRIIRERGPRHRVIIYPPIKVHRPDAAARDVLEIINDINSTLESWIREYPEQWIWLHNRWPSGDKA